MDKKNKGFFTMKDLISLLSNRGFEQHSQQELLTSLQELDDDADGYIQKEELGLVLSTIGEGLDRDELAKFMELASEPNSDRPGLINIKRIANLLLPEIKTETELDRFKHEI